MNERLKLSELNGLVKKAVSDTFTAPIWIIAEISELKTNRSGHCYLALIEKDDNGDTILAQARATIWSYTFRMLKPYFETTTGQQFVEGLKVLVSVSVEFHELYGYSLNIRDIDPTYTLGDMARRRIEIIARLKADGVSEMNKELEIPLVPQKIAVISSSTAAGFQDFVDQLTNNPKGYQFHFKLFPAIMQGNQAESSIIGALEQIYLYEVFFDVVVIIRGGGSQADLSCFDNYNLAYFITQFPLPVITGIGHEKDDSIVDFVAHTRLKTPTAVAEFLIGSVSRFEICLDELSISFRAGVDELLSSAKNTIDQFSRVLAPITREKITKKQVQLKQTVWKIDSSVKMYIKFNNAQIERKEEFVRHEFLIFIQQRIRFLEKISRQLSSSILRLTTGKTQQLRREWQQIEKLIVGIISEKRHHLELSCQQAKLTDPHNILARGYSITLYNGLALKNATKVKNETIIETRLYDGSIISKIINIKTEN